MSRPFRIALDAMGGDHAPDAIVGGALAALGAGGVEILLVGDPARLEPLLAGHGNCAGLRVVAASQMIGMDEAPASALRQKKDASISVAMRLLKEGRADAVVAAGSTGAAMAAALMILGRIPGIERPAIAVPLPTAKGPTVLLDVGANVDSKPSYLLQFALMGSIYAQTVFKRERPRVGLFNIGSEEGKGNELAKEAFALLKESALLNFIGNVEGRDLPGGQADVVVCDGFVGNGLLKIAEGVADLVLAMMKQEVKRSWRNQLGALLLRSGLRNVKRRLDYAEYGGAPLLGVNGVCIIGHGSSNPRAIENAIRVAKEAIDGRLLEAIQQALAQAEPLRK